MTTIQGQQPAKSDDHSAKAARRAGKTSPGTVAPEAGTAFSSMIAESQRKLQAGQLAALAGRAGEDKGADDRLRLFDDDDDGDSAPLQNAPPAQNDTVQGQGGQGANAAVSTPVSTTVQATPEESPDWLTLASLLPAGEDDGVFEVIMPNSARIGVAVSDRPAGVSYLLTPADDLLASRLRGHQMELEGYLRRRIRRNVRVAIL